MQNIDPVYFVTPIVTIAFSFALVIYWHFRRKFTKWALVYSLIAYAGAIALKYIVQIPTAQPFNEAVGGNPIALGLYYGLQTMAFEVGGAYIVARFAVKRNQLDSGDAEGYGLGLAFWENGVLIGAFTLINLVAEYAILSTGNNSLSQEIYSLLSGSTPSLFFSPAQALPVVGLGILERVSSLLAHFSWGYLCIFAVVFRRKRFLAYALPMGLIDFIVPFSKMIGIVELEAIIFIASILCLFVALYSTRKVVRENQMNISPDMQSSRNSSSQSLAFMNFKRAVSYGKIYLILGVALSLLFAIQVSFLHGSATDSSINASRVVSQIPGLILPVFAIIGSTGGLMIFASDKTKGVYEYLIAYGVNTSSIFWSIVLATTGLASIVLISSVVTMIAVMVATGVSLTFTFVELLIFYVIPISYTATMFMSMAGMVWSSLTTRRAGVNSPVGLAPILGIAPVLLVLVLSSLISPSYFIPLVSGVSLALLIAVGTMISVSNKKMVRERFLSNA